VGELEFLSLAPSSRDLVAAEVQLVDVPNRESVLARALLSVRDQYDYVLIDGPPSLGLLTLNALVAADSVLVPLQCEYYALEGLSELLRTIERVRAAYNPRLTVAGILLTMYDSRTNLSHQVEEEVKRHFPDLLFSTVIPRNVRLSEAPSFALPALVYDTNSAGSQAYRELAVEVMTKDNVTLQRVS